MKKLILSIAVLSALSISQAHAQQPANAADAPQGQKEQLTPEQEASRQTEKLTRQLGLTADQKTKVQALALERATANGPLRQQARAEGKGGDKTSLHQQIKANNEKFDTGVTALLTPDQQTKWAALKKSMEEKHDAKKGGGAPAGQ